MLLWIWVIMLLVSVAAWWYYEKKYKGYSELLYTLAGGLFAVGIMGTLLAGTIAICCNTNLDGKIAVLEEEYKVLIYQYENDVYQNSIDLYKRDLLEDIQSWNANLARNRSAQNDFWFGVFVPDIYDRFEFIELK